MTPGFQLTRIALYLAACVVFYRPYIFVIILSVLCFTASDYPFGIFWPLCCLSFLDLQLLITSLVSSGFSYNGGSMIQLKQLGVVA
jgi:hypothetical protein